MKALAITCPGHEQHKQVAGKCTDGENLSVKTSRYTPQFCDHWLSCLRNDALLCQFSCLEESPQVSECCPTTTASESEAAQPCRISEVLASEVDAPTDDQAKVELRKLHNNLGHPTNRDLVRILKNAGGSDQAVRLASEFRCDVCHNRQRLLHVCLRQLTSW